MLKKKFLFIFLFILPIITTGQEPPLQNVNKVIQDKKKYLTSITIGVNYVSWNEAMSLQSGGTIDTDNSNFSGFELNMDKNFMFSKWTFSLGAILGTGKASGGGNSNLISYQNGRQSWNSYGGHAKIFSKINSRFYLGIQVPILVKQIEWSSDQANLIVSSGKNIAVGTLFETLFRLTSDLNMYQAIGFFSASESSTIFKFGLSYRL